MADETQITDGSLIAAEKVNGTNVYNRAGDKLGHVEDIMLDKASGRACYAIMSFGGFLGIGNKHWPLPWSALTIDVSALRPFANRSHLRKRESCGEVGHWLAFAHRQILAQPTGNGHRSAGIPGVISIRHDQRRQTTDLSRLPRP
jgi:PRC-barrel domain